MLGILHLNINNLKHLPNSYLAKITKQFDYIGEKQPTFIDSKFKLHIEYEVKRAIEILSESMMSREDYGQHLGRPVIYILQYLTNDELKTLHNSLKVIVDKILAYETAT